MLKSKELRLGNWIYNPLQQIPFKVDFTALSNVYYDNKLDKPRYEPIPLTEEILLKCGFEKLTEKTKGYKVDTFTYTGGVALILNWDGKKVWTNFWQGTEYKYLHQLQNLYFALTNLELEIEL